MPPNMMSPNPVQPEQPLQPQAPASVFHPTVQQPAAAQPMQGADPLLAESSQRVYTMPQKFIPAKSSHENGAKGGMRKWLLIGSIIFGVLLIVIAIVVYAFQVTTTPDANTNTVPTGNQNTNVQTTGSQTNTNETASANTNAVNTNAAGNVNASLGANINSGLFPNSNTNSTTNSNANAGALVSPSRLNIPDSKDTDKDDLTDAEEAIFSTKETLPDTDKDGYVDGTEVLNGYSPTAASKTLLESGLVVKYTNKKFDWSMHYPAEWIAEPIDETKTQVFFTPDTVEGELVQVAIAENTSQYTAAEWYASLFTDANVDPESLETITVDGRVGVISPDGFSYYFADDAYVIGITYTFGTKQEVSFRTTFEMMVKSFVYAPETDANTNTNATNSN